MPSASLSEAISSSFISQRNSGSKITSPRLLAVRATSARVSSPSSFASASSSGGAIVSRSQPASASICPVESRS